ncbi:MAG TPA: sugar phosphate isomerase/epimerase family protein [Spongiibacteraceae bacterium]|nr:sugar phosphate isomerase/epimerase family protein [Spongiibacteraceae bacterium]
MKKKMGIGVNGWVWTSPFQSNSLHLLAKAAAMGFDVFTVPVEAPELINPTELKAAAADAGIRLHVTGAFGPARDLTHDDVSFRKEALHYIQSTLDLCEKLGVQLMVGPMYSSVGKRRKIPDSQRQVEWERAVIGLREAARMARDHGVILGIEPLNRFETDLVNTAEQAKRLVRDIGDPAARIHLDTFHMNIEEKNIYEAVKLAGDDLVYIDASESDRGTPGTGNVDWRALAKALQEIGYGGDCVIESFTPDCESIAAAAAIWRPLAPTQDLLAQDGLHFLRKILC